jgi:hypothetical protein
MPLKSVTFKGMGLLRRTTRYITLMLILLSDYFRINGNLVDKYSQWVRGATEECGTNGHARPEKNPRWLRENLVSSDRGASKSTGRNESEP